jgi:hypothetical protein
MAKHIKKGEQIDPTKVWVYGKATVGWYVAKWVWDKEYAEHLKSLGYQVERSIAKPEVV